jgi:hypothetical protein
MKTNKISIAEKLDELLERVIQLEDKVEELHKVLVSNNIHQKYNRYFTDDNGNERYLDDEELATTIRYNSNWR